VKVSLADHVQCVSTHLCNPFPSIGCQLFQIPMFFLIVPSPLHGTSHRILSKANEPIFPIAGFGTLMRG
jgi:hypothetical protein